MTREERAWKRLCGGKAMPKPVDPKTIVAKGDYLPEPVEMHPERLTDPHWAMRRWKQGTRGLAVFRYMGLLNEAKLQAHYDLAASQAKRPELDPAEATMATLGKRTVPGLDRA